VKLLTREQRTISQTQGRRQQAFSLMELVTAAGLSTFVLAGLVAFMDMAGKSLSGTAGQSVITHRAGNASEFIFRRVRFATLLSDGGDTSGNTLRLGIDDDYTVDHDGNGKSYDDQDHYEVFQFLNGDGQDSTLADNSLIYKPREDQTNFTVLIPSGVRKLPGRKIFTQTNVCAVYVNFSVADPYAADGYQTCDIQSVFLARNRPTATNNFAILP